MNGTTPEGYDVEVKNPTLDLDRVVPHELLRHQKVTEDYLDAVRKDMPDHHGSRACDHRWRGRFNVETMLDWRRTERSMAKVTMKLEQRHREFWGHMNDLLAIAKANKGQKVWVCHPDVEQRTIMDYDGGLRFVEPITLIDPHVGNPDLKAYIVKGEQAVDVYDRYRRYERLRMRRGVISNAFYEAVAVRLREVLNAMRTESTRYYAPTLTYIVQNEGRSYVFKHHDYNIEFDDFTSVYVAT